MNRIVLVIALVALVGAAVGIAVVEGAARGGRLNPLSWRGDAPSVRTQGSQPLLTLGDPISSGRSAWPGIVDATPTAYDVDGDGVDELLIHSNDTNVYVHRVTDGRALAVIPTSYPPGWYVERVLNKVAAGSLVPGEPTSVVIANHAAYVAAWKFDPDASTSDRFVFHRSWEHRMDTCFWNPGMDAHTTVADSNGDGSLETFVQTEEIGFFALNADGSLRWHHCWAGGNAAIVVEDLDGDTRPEAVVASDDGLISVLNADTGQPSWSFNAADPAYGIRPASISVSPTVVELDGVAPKELLFTARHAPVDDPELYRTFHMAIFAVHQDPATWMGTLLWMRQPEWAHPLSYTRLLVADVDADGSPDIFGMDWNTIGHIPGKWEMLGMPHVFRLAIDGSDVWVKEIDAWWSNKDIALGDTNKDGSLDVIVNAAFEGSDGIWRLSTADGGRLGLLLTAPWKLQRGPVFLDLWHNGGAQVAFPVVPDVAVPTKGAVLVYDLDRIASKR